MQNLRQARVSENEKVRDMIRGFKRCPICWCMLPLKEFEQDDWEGMLGDGVFCHTCRAMLEEEAEERDVVYGNGPRSPAKPIPLALDKFDW